MSVSALPSLSAGSLPYFLARSSPLHLTAVPCPRDFVKITPTDQLYLIQHKLMTTTSVAAKSSVVLRMPIN